MRWRNKKKIILSWKIKKENNLEMENNLEIENKIK